MKRTLFMSFLATILITLLTINISSNYSNDNNSQSDIVFAGVNGNGPQSGNQNHYRNRDGNCKGDNGHKGDGKHGGRDVPEPLTMALVAGGLLGLGVYRKYNKDDDESDK